MIKVALTDSASGKELHSEDYCQEGCEGHRVLLVTNIPKHYGFFKTYAYTVQGTVEQISARGDGSIELTDLIVTFEKKQAGVVIINFHDGINTAQLLRSPLTDSNLNLSANLVGRWKGWAAAHIDVIISGADSIGTVAIGYIRHNEANSLPYTEWNALR